jgi:hypothetical protein
MKMDNKYSKIERRTTTRTRRSLFSELSEARNFKNENFGVLAHVL